MPIIGRRRPVPAKTQAEVPSDEEAPATQAEDGYEDTAFDGQGDPQSQDLNLDQLIKKMVRLALASEYARLPVRRADVASKVLPEQSRQFKAVFEGAQKELRTAFGMQMEELPIKEKVTIAQRRAAQKSDKAQTTSKSWILVSILPPEYRTPEILKPPQVPTTATESAYIGLYSFIIAIISLCGGSCNEAKLERYLKRANADQYTPVEKTDRLLIRMIKEGYLVKIKEPAGGGEDQVEYMVGPRGKVEVGSSGVSGLVKTVYADSEIDDLDQRIAKSLGLQGLARRVREEESDAGVPQTQQDDTQSRRVSVRKRRARDDEDD